MADENWFERAFGGVGEIFSDVSSGLGGLAQDIFGEDVDLGALGSLAATLGLQSGAFDDILQAAGLDFLIPGQQNQPVGYQGSIPNLVAVRERVPQEQIAPPRPGAMNQRYFSDTIYAQKPESMMARPTLEAATATAREQAQGLGALPASRGAGGQGSVGTLGGPGYGEYPLGTAGPRVDPSDPNYRPPPRSSGGGSGIGTGTMDEGRPELRAAGGLLGLAKGGYYLGGPTDGMADKVPARIDGRQEARLSDGEFVIPADVVSHLGNGNSNAGAQQLYAMMDRVRKARTGRESQGKQINPSKYMPGMRA